MVACDATADSQLWSLNPSSAKQVTEAFVSSESEQIFGFGEHQQVPWKLLYAQSSNVITNDRAIWTTRASAMICLNALSMDIRTVAKYVCPG